MSLETFFETPVPSFNKEIRNRIRLSVYAYAYEFEDDSLISDTEFDSLCIQINPSESTGNRKMDNFFKKHFDPSTGMWIRKHPDLNGIKRVYEKYYKN